MKRKEFKSGSMLLALMIAVGGLFIACDTTMIKVESVSLNESNLTLVVGDSISLVPTVLPDNATEKTVVWSSSDPSVATVDSNGKVTAVAGGNIIITVITTDGAMSATCDVRVGVRVKSVSLNESNLNLSVGDSASLVATVLPANAADQTVVWSSSDPSVATVDSNGKVTAVAEGNATITVTTTDGAMSATCDVRVEDGITYGTIPSFKMRDVPVPAGGIIFPSKEDDSETMKVAKPFFAAETEVTWALWDAVSQWNSDNSKGYDFKGAGQKGAWNANSTISPSYTVNPCDANHPVTMVSWRDAIVFCNALTQWINETQSPATPLIPVYYSDAAYTQLIKVTDTETTSHTNAGEIDSPYIKAATNGNTDMANCSANGFRLPTSAEWECAARWQGKKNLNDNFVNPLPSSCTAGYYWTKGNSASGSSSVFNGSDTTNVAVYGDNNSSLTTAEVKSKTANGLGLYDVSGNVWEWCVDLNIHDGHRLCGGCWSTYSWLLQGGYVNGSYSSDRKDSYGLRVFQS